MLDLFCLEADTQGQVLTAGLLALERNPVAAESLEACMRAAHSLKGAARVVGLHGGVSVAHAMEDCFVAAQLSQLVLNHNQIDRLLCGVDLLARIGKAQESAADIDVFLSDLKAAIDSPQDHVPARSTPAAAMLEPAPVHSPGERVLRVTADNLNRLLGLTGESVVESRWVGPFAESLVRLKRLNRESGKTLAGAREALAGHALSEKAEVLLSATHGSIQLCEELLSQRLAQLDAFESRSTDLAKRFYDEALACSMRPFGDAMPLLPRMIRDLSRALGKPAHLEITGEGTLVDRDVLEKIDAPLGHLLRNAVDHGIESAAARRLAGKPAEGVIRLEARHSSGLLQISVSDDGAGVDPEAMRRAIVRRKLAAPDFAQALSDAELLEFLFLPGFTLKEAVTDVSGRGVGLDAVLTMVKQVRGTVRVTSQLGAGTRFVLFLPLTLSVVRTLLVEVGGEAYAFPLAYMSRLLLLPPAQIKMLEGRQLVEVDDHPVGLVSGCQVFGGAAVAASGDLVPIIVIGSSAGTFGLVVDRFIGERELVVQALDSRLGKVKDIAAAALMADGSAVLIVDVEDLLRSLEKLAGAGTLNQVPRETGEATGPARKRVLIVDDSLTVRELERKLLATHGFDIEVAVDGMEGWNAVRTGKFDLVITDIDMPRMDGIELDRKSVV